MRAMGALCRDALTARQEVPATGVPFHETPYGIVKRIRVIVGWIGQIRDRTGKQLLTVLDYGCGTGDHVTFPLACAGDEVMGVDIHLPSILEARRRYALPNLSFRAGVIQDLLAEGLSFDVIVCSEVLEHLHDPLKFLTDVRRLLRPGGGLIVTTPNGYGSFETLRGAERAFTQIGVHQGLRWVFHKVSQLGRLVKHDQNPSAEPEPGFLNCDSIHVQFFRVRSLEKLFSESGFRIVARRARTFLCGPYVDTLFRLSPGRQVLFRVNNRLADLLPFTWAADWMFLLEPKGVLHP